MHEPTTLHRHYLARPGGRIAYDLQGEGPLVVCVPGMGDLRTVYRFLAEALTQSGYKVAVMDLRGHGGSDATFAEYDDVATGNDIIALVTELGGPAAVIGNSMGAGAAAWAAAEAPHLITALVLIGPFVRNPAMNPVMAAVFRLALLRPWGRLMWRGYFKSLYPGRKPAGFEEHAKAADDSLRRPDYWQAFTRTTHTSHAPVEARLAEVNVPSLVIMGEKDPDFADPKAEAAHVADRLHGKVFLVPDAGHYPQAEAAGSVSPAVVSFLKGLPAGG